MSWLWVCDWVCWILIPRLHLTTLLRRLWLWQGGSGHTANVLASLFYSGRKWRCVIHLFYSLWLYGPVHMETGLAVYVKNMYRICVLSRQISPFWIFKNRVPEWINLKTTPLCYGVYRQSAYFVIRWCHHPHASTLDAATSHNSNNNMNKHLTTAFFY